MKISTNMIGNYTQNIARNVNTTAKPKEADPKFELNAAGQTKANSLTTDEKNFFANLYPDKKNEIVDHHYYNRSGELSGVKVGSLIDRRG